MKPAEDAAVPETATAAQTEWYDPMSPPAPQQQPAVEAAPETSPSVSSDARPLRVYADGIYDLFHFGHARALEQAKKSFPNTYLLVGCCSDEITHRYKGKTVMTEDERYESLRHCKWVDEVIPDAPWVINQEFIDKHNIDYVAHDALPYADTSGAANDVYEFVRTSASPHCFGWASRGSDDQVRECLISAFVQVKAIGKFKETKRTEGISTSDIIMRILKDYNQYIMRNLTRGYSRKDLGVSYVKEKQLRVNMGFSKLREKVKEHQEKFHSAAKIAGSNPVEWMENADRWIVGFLEKFEEGCHMMETAIKDRIQEGLKRQSRSESNLSGGSGEDSDY
ncbi:hypothetical protein PAHAL_6G042500 [Panicum hallii]|uniref:choline-phosphate cytidylyltransferase n=1 Tax=Panicum hallii TaxID=206008 RepID=A0A2T8IF52_9POAL|nr:hypothetical protein PAHAL_6G042500 [Panicum hallii]